MRFFGSINADDFPWTYGPFIVDMDGYDVLIASAPAGRCGVESKIKREEPFFVGGFFPAWKETVTAAGTGGKLDDDVVGVICGASAAWG